MLFNNESAFIKRNEMDITVLRNAVVSGYVTFHQINQFFVC